ncbi:hypothetical protein P170DRAFT_507272 [Aspergillus steynii IBT 23096]|uniref:Uncharacterized protein n=1 Tax=Aspergillus steynii IBT 23096 TaxID=1392250 RepID=A0A2I2GHY9_9EURO|nr:uncharacterized protein P170DRAFT_507272 [Aspergillus steynii IBT 23096]PLB52496.1 hypothetical protein P170DRAFT_507272 [Aspergillus steynii IBT 23096]
MARSVEMDSLQPSYEGHRANSHTSEDPLLQQNSPILTPQPEPDEASVSEEAVHSPMSPDHEKGVKEDDNGFSPGLPMFNPIWLSKTCLGGFIVALILIGIALGLVYCFAERDNGFVLIFNDRYSWAYGPTVVLVLVAGLWRQVDYWCKTLAPWRELQQGWAPANKSLFLDYVGQIHIFGCWAALKNKHWTVSASVVGVLILKLMTAFASALLVLQPAKVSSGAISVYEVGMNSTVPHFDGIDVFSPVYSYYGVLAHGLPYPKGTAPGFMVPNIYPKDSLLDGTTRIAANVTGYWPSLKCQTGNVNWTMLSPDPDADNDKDRVRIRFETSDGRCSVGKMDPDTAVFSLRDHSRDILPERLVYPRMKNLYANCTGNETDLDVHPSLRLLFAILDVRNTQDLKPNAEELLRSVDQATVANSASIEVKSVTAVLCEQSIIGKRARVEVNPSDADTQRGPGLDVTPISTMTSQQLLQGGSMDELANNYFEMMWRVMKGSPNVLGQDKGTEAAFRPFFRLMLIESDSSDYGSFLDVERLTASAANVYIGLAVQSAYYLLYSYLKSPDQVVSGEGFHYENRLFVQKTPVGVMVTCVALMICISVGVIMTRPFNVVPRSPDSVGAVMTFLPKSKLTKILAGTAHWPFARLSEALKGQRFRTRFVASVADSYGKPTFTIDADCSDEPHKQTANERSYELLDDMPQKIWRPLAYTLPFRLLVLISPVVIIIIVEVLQQVSAKNGGFMDVPRDSSVIFWAKFITSGVMISIGLMYGTFDFGLALLAPYRLLSQGSAASKRTIFANYLRDIPVVGLWRSLRDGQLAVFFSLFATLAASVFTIAASGLYIVDYQNSLNRTLSVQRSDVFNLTWTHSYNDSHAGTVLNLIEQSNLTSPRFTYNNLVFPIVSSPVSFNQRGGGTEQAQGHMTLRLPALRARLDCKTLDTATLYKGNTPSKLKPEKRVPYVSLQTTIDLEDMYPRCKRGRAYGDKNMFKFNTSIYFPEKQVGNGPIVQKPAYGGYFFDLHLGDIPDSENVSKKWAQFEEWGNSDLFVDPYTYSEYPWYTEDNYDMGRNPEGCPSIGFSFGPFIPLSTNTTDVTSGVCDQYIEEVTTEARFILPSLELDPGKPPVPDESTAHVLGNGHGFDMRQFRPQYNIEQSMLFFNPNASRYMDVFYQSVVNGIDAIPETDLVGKANIHRLLNATSDFYGKYMALAISYNMRQNTSFKDDDLGNAASRSIEGQNDDSSFKASVVYPSARLKIDRNASLALEILLTIAFVCSAIACALAWTPVAIMQNPGQISGAVALVAGSTLASRKIVPEGTEWLNSKTTQERKIFDGLQLRLGWTDGDDGARRYGIDVDNRQSA